MGGGVGAGVVRSSVESNSAIPWTVTRQASLSMEFFKQEYWSGFPCPSGDLPDPGIEPVSLMSPALAGRFFVIEPPGKPNIYTPHCKFPKFNCS